MSAATAMASMGDILPHVAVLTVLRANCPRDRTVYVHVTPNDPGYLEEARHVGS